MKNNKLYIYIANEDKKKIDEVKIKYKLSLSAIVDILIYVTLDCLTCNADKEVKEKFTTKHLYPLINKTSIQMPKRYKKDLNFKNVDKTRFANNCLNAFIKKDIAKYIKNADILNGKYGYWNRIHQEMQKTIDPRWNYNENLRNQVMIVKKNKEYFKKILGE